MGWQILAWGRPADAAAGGLIVLAVGSLAARLCRQPVRRTRLVVLTLLGGVAVPGLGALPIVPRWSAGLVPAPAPLSSRPEDGAPRIREASPARLRRRGRETPSISPGGSAGRRRAPPGPTLP